jgi:AcrR family transcriptional regulator
MSSADPRVASRDRRKQVTRDQLLKSAEHLFLEHGFHRTSIDDIAGGAGFTKGAVYTHFDSKEEVFIALTERRWDDQLARVHAALDDLAASPAGHRLASFLQLTRSLLWDDPGWQLLALEFSVYAARHPSVQKRLSERHHANRSMLAELLAHDLDERGIDPAIPPDDLAAVLLAFFNGIALKHSTNPDRDDDNLLSAAIRLINRALRA